MPDPLHDAVLLSLVPGIGPVLSQSLVQHFGSPTAVLDAAPSRLREVRGISSKLSGVIARARQEIDVGATLDECRACGVQVLSSDNDAYPRSLVEIPDPPRVLYVRGTLTAADALAVAIVGSRHATQYGKDTSQRLAASLARAGMTVVSGLARGIDAAAHRGALEAGGRTIAVLGSGVLSIYPPEHEKLAEEIASHGALVSEAPLRAPPRSGSFPQRNRIISGLALGVVVVEASHHSGALITARHAMEQNRDVFAVPGRVDSRMSRGCHRLIRDGAKLVEAADDVLEELGHLVEATTGNQGQEVHHPAELLLNELEQQVLAAVSSDRSTIDDVVAGSGLPTPQVLATLNVLEMRRLIRRLGGNAVMRV